MKNIAKVLIVLVALALQFGCPKDTCKECTSANYTQVCPVLHKVCPGYTMDVQQCSGNCCTTDVGEISCTLDFLGQILREEIVNDVAVIESLKSGRHTVILIDGTQNGWVTAAMPENEVRRVMEGKLAEIHAIAQSLK